MQNLASSPDLFRGLRREGTCVSYSQRKKLVTNVSAPPANHATLAEEPRLFALDNFLTEDDASQLIEDAWLFR